MLGKDLYKIENTFELSNERLKSLAIFYRPLIGSECLSLYLHFVYAPVNSNFKELNDLLSILNISIDVFETCLMKLNKFKLLKTLKYKNDNKYIFEVRKPMNSLEFVKDDILPRAFIKTVSGEYYQNILSELRLPNVYDGYEDVSTKFEPEILNSWTKEDETYIKPIDKQYYNIDTFFDVKEFLKDISTHLLPMKYRTYENMKTIGTLADLYNISFEKMKTYLPKIVRNDSNSLNIDLLKTLCINSQSEYHKIENGKYDEPCLLFLMNLQDGKEATKYDRSIIYTLSYEYDLKPAVINVLIEHSLKNCDNRLIEKYVYALASDLHRNNINSANEALNRLDRYRSNKKTISSTIKYDDSSNSDVDLSALEDFRKKWINT